MRAPRIVFAIVVIIASALVVTAPPAGAGGGGCRRDMERGPSEAEGDTVQMVDVCMSPSVLRVATGATVTFVNRDKMMHNLYGSGMFAGELAPGDSAAFRFDDAGTYPFACTLHAGMVGAVAVGDGRRTAPDSASIVPLSVAPSMALTTTTAEAPTPTAAPVPLAARRPAPSDDDLPMVPMAVILAAAAAIAYGAGARRRRPTPSS